MLLFLLLFLLRGMPGGRAVRTRTSASCAVIAAIMARIVTRASLSVCTTSSAKTCLGSCPFFSICFMCSMAWRSRWGVTGDTRCSRLPMSSDSINRSKKGEPFVKGRSTYITRSPASSTEVMPYANSTPRQMNTSTGRTGGPCFGACVAASRLCAKSAPTVDLLVEANATAFVDPRKCAIA